MRNFIEGFFEVCVYYIYICGYPNKNLERSNFCFKWFLDIIIFLILRLNHTVIISLL